MHDDILILGGTQVASLLAGRELELIQTVRLAYQAHASGKSSLPHSTFLHFPDDSRNRIIALPAYLGDGFETAGIKWISSFPGNIEKQMDRASAVIVLNSTQTGRPEAIIEGSVISAKRTAASAALAAQVLHRGKEITSLALIGTGLINFEITRFIRAACPALKRLIVFDLDERRARQFRDRCNKRWERLEVEMVSDVEAALSSSSLVSIATTVSKPHISDLGACPAGATLLHISLRDLSPEVILSCDNVVDDVDHVCRAQTSIHLAEQLVGNREFIRCTLAEILSGETEAKKDEQTVSVFSPFGLGVLDMAVARHARDLALKQGVGERIDNFLPPSWSEDAESTRIS